MNAVRTRAPVGTEGCPRREGHTWAEGRCDPAGPGVPRGAAGPVWGTVSIQTFPKRSVAHSEHSQPLADARLAWHGFLSMEACAWPSRCWTCVLWPCGQCPGPSRSKRARYSTGIFYLSSICLSILCTYWLALREGAVKYWPGVSSWENVMLLLCL